MPRLPVPPSIGTPFAIERQRGAGSGLAVGAPERGAAAVPDNRHDGDGTMNTAMAMPGNTASTFLIHLFGSGLEDDRYVVERFRALADGDIRPVRPEASPDRGPGQATRKGRRGAKRVTASLSEVWEMRPARTEIIVCTGLRTRGGQQLWGSVAAGLLCDRRQRG